MGAYQESQQGEAWHDVGEQRMFVAVAKDGMGATHARDSLEQGYVICTTFASYRLKPSLLLGTEASERRT